MKLPSRNWMIFLSITGSWTAAVLYDRRQRKNVQKKWCELVSDIAKEPLETNTLPRRVTIFLSAPPGDGLRSAREHFTEYVKPVLVAAALDWDVVEGRREGEVRAGVAERIRRHRRKRGDVAETLLEEDVSVALERIRERIGVMDYPGTKGDIVIGRNTWKEYVRGLHEGWLGPMDPPKPTTETIDATPAVDADRSINSSASTTQQDPSTPDKVVDEFLNESSSTTKPTPDTPPKTEKPSVVPAYNTATSYAESQLSHFAPAELTPSAPIAFPHILGFLNTPIRAYRFLNRRTLADDIGRQTAAAVLAAHRGYEHTGEETSSTDDGPQRPWEQQRILAHEEADWNKASRKREEGEGERVRLDEMVVDPRIGSRMRRFELDSALEERAKEIEKGLPGLLAELWSVWKWTF